MTDLEKRKAIAEMTEQLIKRIRLNQERFPDSMPLGVVLCINKPTEMLAVLLPSDEPEIFQAMQIAIKEIAQKDSPDMIKEFSNRDN